MMNWYPYFNYSNVWMMSWMPFLLLLLVVDIILRGLALWRSARAGQQYWFIALLVLNSAGILPVIYLLWFSKKSKTGKK